MYILGPYLTQESKATQIQTPTYTTPVKCNIKLQGKPYHAVIDSGATISMISYQVVKELGLKIEAPSTSLIVSAAGSSVRPLGIIKNLPIEIEGTTIPLDVEVMNATSYSLLLGNDWSHKVDASYNWKNKAYTLRWNKKKIHVPTTYENNQPLPTQPTLTDEKDLEKFEQEYLSPKEAFIADTEPNIWTTVTRRPRPSASFSNQKCGRCYSYNHLYADCPNNKCYRCHRYGHLAAHCPRQAPKRNICKTCSQPGHLYKDCPENRCYQCGQYGHIGAICPQMTQKLENQRFECGCDPQAVNAQRLPHYTRLRTNHCCKCKVPRNQKRLDLWTKQWYAIDIGLTSTMLWIVTTPEALNSSPTVKAE